MRKTIGSLAIALLTGMAAPAFAQAPEKWGKLCAKCHGEDGKGKTKMGEKLKIGDMTSSAWQAERKDADMKKTIREGSPAKKKPATPADKLTDPELEAMVKFVRSLKGK